MFYGQVYYTSVSRRAATPPEKTCRRFSSNPRVCAHTRDTILLSGLFSLSNTTTTTTTRRLSAYPPVLYRVVLCAAHTPAYVEEKKNIRKKSSLASRTRRTPAFKSEDTRKRRYIDTTTYRKNEIRIASRELFANGVGVVCWFVVRFIIARAFSVVHARPSTTMH